MGGASTDASIPTGREARAGVQPPLSKSDAVWVCAAEPVVPRAETVTCAALTAELADTVSVAVARMLNFP